MSERGQIARWLISLGPLAVSVAVYGLALDHLPDGWFKYGVLRYIVAGLIAFCVGLLLKFFGERHLVAQSGNQHKKITEQLSQPTLSSNRNSFMVGAIFEGATQRLTSGIRYIKRNNQVVIGWSQFLEEDVPPSAIGTAYGLKIAMALDIRDIRLNRLQLTKSLLALERQGGGWAASTQRGQGRPEVTAWVLEAAVRSGIDERTTKTLSKTLELLYEQDDPVGRNRTTVVSSIISSLGVAAPSSFLLVDLANCLIDGAKFVDGEVPTASWGEKLSGQLKDSPAHSARAIIALSRAGRALPAAAKANLNIDRYIIAGLAWLRMGNIDLASQTEQLRRPQEDGDVDAIVIGHFTAAWVARALMLTSGEPVSGDLLVASIDEVLGHQENGVWMWADGSSPIWMTYQGIATLRQYCLNREVR